MATKLRKHRDYDNMYPSVTTIISQLSNYGLMEWFKRTPYDKIIRESSRGKKIGTDMHTAIQNYIETGNAEVSTEYPDEVSIALKSFVLFRKENPKYILKSSEIKLTSDIYKFNGTTDLTVEVDGELWIGDWKSQNVKTADKPKAYEDYFTQVSAYVHLYNEIKLENVKKAVIIVLAKDKVSYSINEIDEETIIGEFNNVFLPLLKIWEYRHAKNV